MTWLNLSNMKYLFLKMIPIQTGQVPLIKTFYYGDHCKNPTSRRWNDQKEKEYSPI